MKKNIILPRMLLGIAIIIAGFCLGAAAFRGNTLTTGISWETSNNLIEGNNLNTGQLQAAAANLCPCDIYADGGTPCVAAHSTVRALYSAYNGSLYQVRRASDKTTKDIPVLSAGGFANSAVQDSFCAGTTCTISIIYDQSGKGNHLTVTPPGGWLEHGGTEANATAARIVVSGHPVYGVYTTGSFDAAIGGVGYRNNKTSGIATGDQPEGIYMVCSGRHYNQWCCFDYGNAETNNLDNGDGTMETVYFGNSTQWGHGSGSGPWVMADLENGVFAGGTLVNNNNTPIIADYVTGMVKGNSGNSFAIRGGDATKGTLKTMYNGPRPNGYSPMKKEGAIVLGVGGDNSHTGEGTFFEGALTYGYPSDATEDAIQANIIAAKYGSTSTPGPTGTPAATPTPNQNPIWTGGPYTLNGTSDYKDMPDGLNNNLYDFSIVCWVKLNSLVNWARIFDFGGDTNVYMMLTTKSGSTGFPYFAITTSGNSGEQGINGTGALATGSWQHLAVVKNGNTGILYINKQEVGRNTGITLRPADMGNTVNNYIGKSQWSNDPYLNGSIDKFAVYNRALSASEVTALGNNPPGVASGDADGSGTIDIVDALMTAQYSVGLAPAGFIAANADVNCDGSITIVDALMIAQYYVGLITKFSC